MFPLIRKTVARVAERKVRRVSPGRVGSLMVAAGSEGLAHQGNLEWFRSNNERFPDIYLVPVSGMRLRSADVRCAIVLMGRGKGVVWITLDVSPWSLVSLRGSSPRETVKAVGELVGGYPVVKGDGSHL